VLSRLVRQQPAAAGGPAAVASLPDAPAGETDVLAMLAAAGTLWLHGVSVDWKQTHGPGAQRCPLPTYPFERQRYWIDPPAPGTPTTLPKPSPETAMPDTRATPSRAPRLRAAVIDILQDLSGMDLAGCDPGATFL